MELTIKEIKKFVTPDGREFNTFKEAKDYAKWHHAVDKIYDMLGTGLNLTIDEMSGVAEYIVDNHSMVIGILNEYDTTN
jgi:hypothetical protein